MSEAAATHPPARVPAEPLVEAWATRPGVLGWLSAVNHKPIGLRFIVTALLFLAAGGVQAVLMRTQLAVPENDVVSSQTYNELFTMHGTTMMFLFAVPVVEGLGMYLVPLMLGTRDLPFPRLNAFGYWTYLFGGLFVYASFLTGEVPDGGWFAYTPLTGPEFSPGRNLDFWLLGVTFVEISAIVGAVELIVAFARRRAPGMRLERVPIFAWSILVMAFMILFAFPALVTASVLLEVERAFGAHFYDPSGGGDPLLWQHLFWFFGHPEVYIMFLPAAGVVSMVVPTLCRRRLAAYPLVIAALVAIGIVSFGLWVHHMFAVGLPFLALAFFAAASFLIAIPSGVQVFAWLATMWNGRPRFATPLLFVVGFLLVFVVGGITGVMVAAVPFDWQAHDSYFVVAHFHYVLIGGVVFPVFAGLYYWFPKWTGRVLGEGLGKASFWALFAGINVAFFPQHLLGLQGMPRRVVTYPVGEGWELGNLVSSVGAYLLAVGFGLTLVNAALALARRPGPEARNPWDGGTLEWQTDSPPAPYGFRELPLVRDRYPVWEPEEEEAARPAVVGELAAPRTAVREVLETSTLAAEPLAVVRLPGPTLLPLGVAGALVVALVGGLYSSASVIAVGCAVAVVLLVVWGASSAATAPDGDEHPRSLPVRSAGAGVWGVSVGLAAVAVMLGSLLYGYFHLRALADEWPGAKAAPALAPGLAAAVLGLAAVAAGLVARRADGRRRTAAIVAAAVAAAGLAGALAWSLAGLDTSLTTDAHGSIVVALLGFVLVLAVALALTLGVVVRQALTRPADVGVSLAVATTLAAFVAASTIVVFLVVSLVPRL